MDYPGFILHQFLIHSLKFKSGNIVELTRFQIFCFIWDLEIFGDIEARVNPLERNGCIKFVARVSLCFRLK